ncbi:hypothetical protein SPHINGOT1_140051 [Sphingomonas sp. T1]|nr:hypothetical protein SPHINGOT1_140051 [Sphingomonas sp. T1]
MIECGPLHAAAGLASIRPAGHRPDRRRGFAAAPANSSAAARESNGFRVPLCYETH